MYINKEQYDSICNKYKKRKHVLVSKWGQKRTVYKKNYKKKHGKLGTWIQMITWDKNLISEKLDDYNFFDVETKYIPTKKQPNRCLYLLPLIFREQNGREMPFFYASHNVKPDLLAIEKEKERSSFKYGRMNINKGLVFIDIMTRKRHYGFWISNGIDQGWQKLSKSHFTFKGEYVNLFDQ